ncbi:hypothetical protein H0E87_031239, partial [Populus deltoides]
LGVWGSYGVGLAAVHVTAEATLEMGMAVRSAGSMWSAVFGPLWEATSWREVGGWLGCVEVEKPLLEGGDEGNDQGKRGKSVLGLW